MSLEKLIIAIQKEAEHKPFPIDIEVYEKVNKNPLTPILYAGSLLAKVGFFARDLGKDEVYKGEPLIGSAGKLVRKGVFRALYNREPKKEEIEQIKEYILLTNTVPYKPPGNKAYIKAVKERFRPFIAEFLITHWQGSYLIPLGAQALDWFSVYAEKGIVKNFAKDKDRFTKELNINLEVEIENIIKTKEITLLPLPHPSPLNRKYYSLFPDMLANRLAQIGIGE